MNTQDAQKRINEAYELLKWRHIIEKQEDLATIMGTSRPNVSAALAGKATINDAPFVRNRVTDYSGPLFGSSSGWSINLNDEWDDSYTGTW